MQQGKQVTSQLLKIDHSVSKEKNVSISKTCIVDIYAQSAVACIKKGTGANHMEIEGRHTL